jgi:hypothetical protein
MTAKTSSIEEHRRKIFFNNLSLKTTRDSLSEYLSSFEIEMCWVAWEESNIYIFE